MSHSIHSLFGDTPVKNNNTDFVMGSPTAKIWSTVVQREKNGQVVQKDITSGLGLIEAIDHANSLRSIYRLDGFVENEGRFEDPKQNGEYVFIFVL